MLIPISERRVNSVKSGRWARGLAAGLLAVSGALAAARAEFVPRQPDSIFDADGLKADLSDPSGKITGEVFQAGIKKYPLVDVRKPILPPSSAGRMSSFQAGGPSPDLARASFQSASVYARQRDWPKALSEIEQALEHDPENPFLIQRAAAFAALARNFGLADVYFQKSLRADPDNVDFLAGRAGVLIRLLRLKEAGELAQKALQANPSHLSSRFQELCVRVALGDTNTSWAGWEMLDTDQVLEAADWLDADREDYIKVLKPEGYSNFCDIVLGPNTAEHVTEIATSLKKASLALRAGQFVEARGALASATNAGVRAAGVSMDIGKCLFQMGDRRSAVLHFHALAARYPESSVVLYNYAYVLINMEMYSQAGAVLEKVCKLTPQEGQAAFALACTYAAREQINKAWPILTRLASSHPAEMPEWMEGDKPYQEAIRKDPRYPELKKTWEAAQAAAP